MSGAVAVAVLHHGDRALTEACLRSSLAIEPPPAMRIVLWNEPLPAGPPLPADLAGRVEVVEAGRNRGFTGGANLAARAAAARALLEQGAAAIVVKAGHGEEDPARDLVLERTGPPRWLEHARIRTRTRSSSHPRRG